MPQITVQCEDENVIVLCFETEEMKTEFNTEDNKLPEMLSEATACISNLKAKRAAEFVEAVNKIATKWGSTMLMSSMVAVMRILCWMRFCWT